MGHAQKRCCQPKTGRAFANGRPTRVRRYQRLIDDSPTGAQAQQRAVLFPDALRRHGCISKAACTRQPTRIDFSHLANDNIKFFNTRRMGRARVAAGEWS